MYRINATISRRLQNFDAILRHTSASSSNRSIIGSSIRSSSSSSIKRLWTPTQSIINRNNNFQQRRQTIISCNSASAAAAASTSTSPSPAAQSSSSSSNRDDLSSQSQSSPSSSSSSRYNVGDLIHNYAVEAIESIPELCLTAYRLRHTRNGAEHLHIDRDDSNNVFSVSFRTTPTDSTGVAHILEHLALCGSAKYPVRDPFMKMISRSLATHMNAYTGPDYTMYPFSTQNYKDFYNLLSIYLDASFHPQLRPLDFLQEGWRLEHTDVHDRQSPLIFKGVVFNEMKGVFSSPSMIYIRSVMQKLFPDTTYSNESGGDPLAIPALSHEQLKDFHAKHYHPSNARFYTYGNFPLADHLAAIDAVIGEFDDNASLRAQSRVTDQPRWNAERAEKLRCQNDPLAAYADKQTTLGVTYMLESLCDTHENFTLSALGSLLIDGPSSPFYRELIDTGLGSDYSPFAGVHRMTKQSFFSIGLQGIAEDRCSAVRKAIRAAFKNAADEGFPRERIDALLHRIELGTRHHGADFGLGLAMNVNAYWNHDVDPIRCLRVHEHVERFERAIRDDPKYLQKKIREHFLANPHRLVVEMSPADDYEQKLAEAEAALLSAKIAELTDSQRDEIFANGQRLLAAQDTAEDHSILPTLAIGDIARETRKTNLEHIRVTSTDVPIQYSIQPTNGIVYFNAIIRLDERELPRELLPYLPLFTHVITRLGAGEWDRREFDQLAQLTTDGLAASAHVVDHPARFDRHEQGIAISSHCLARNIERMFDLWGAIFAEGAGVRFDDDHEHLAQLIRIAAADLSAGVSHAAHRYAMNRASFALGGSLRARELIGGMASLAYFRLMASSPDKIAEIVKHLKRIAEIAFRRDSLRCAINAESAAMPAALHSVERFVASMRTDNQSSADNDKDGGGGPSTDTMIVKASTIDARPNEHFIFPFSTNYLAQSIYGAPFRDRDYAALRIGASLLSTQFLHREIREKGGAYGGGVRLDSAGVISFYSYRDPHVTQTIETFERAGAWLMRPDNYTASQIDEAKLQVFQSVDAPITAAQQGLEYFIAGIDDAMRQEYRMRLLDVTQADIQDVAERYLTGNANKLKSGFVLLGPSNEVTSNNDKWKIRKLSD